MDDMMHDDMMMQKIKRTNKSIMGINLGRYTWLEGMGAGTDRQKQEKQWTSLWKVQVPSKIHMFLWRLAKRSLPTADVCHHRNMG
jgi:hypothetical protein